MKKLFFILLLMPLFLHAQEKVSAITASVYNAGFTSSNIRIGLSFNISDTSFGGGLFYIAPAMGNSVDSVITFPTRRSDLVLKRATSTPNKVDIRWAGAKGLGVRSNKQDSTAIVNAIDYFWDHGAGSLYFPGVDSFYAFSGNGLILPDDLEIYGDGTSSNIKHINPQGSVTKYKGTIFFPGTFANNYNTGILNDAVPHYPIKNTKPGQAYFFLDTSAGLSSFKVGDVIYTGVNKFYKKGDTTKPRYEIAESNEIIRISVDTLFVKYSLEATYTYNALTGRKPEVRRINAATGFVPTYLNTTRQHHMSKGLYIHDMELSQATYNMLTGERYSPIRSSTGVIHLGSTFDSRFENLTLDSYGTIAGNLWGHCTFSNLNIIGSKNVVDLGYNSNHVKCVNWTFNYKYSIGDTLERAMMYLNDGIYDVLFDGLKVEGPWNGNNMVQFSGSAHRITMKNFSFNLPQYRDSTLNALSFDDENDTSDLICSDITIQHGLIKADTIGKFINFRGDGDARFDRNIVLDDIVFDANYVSKISPAASLINCGNITCTKLTFKKGDSIEVNQATGSKFIDIDAPQMVFNKLGGNANDIFIERCNWRGFNVYSSIYIKPAGSVAGSYNPVDGQVWNDSSHIYARIKGANVILDNVGVSGAGTYGYPLLTNYGSLNPAVSTTYGAGMNSNYGFTTSGVGSENVRIYLPVAGTITKATILIQVGGTLGSTETSNFYIRLNNTTDYLVNSSMLTNVASRRYSTTSLSIPVGNNFADYIEYKWVTPAWATPPTTVRISLLLWVQQ